MNSSTKILICGDICPTKDTTAYFEAGNPDALFNDIIPIVKEADYVMGNLEFVLTDNANPIEKAGPILHGPKNYIDILRNAGFNLLSLANNHIKDCGEEGVKSTIESCKKAGIEIFGAGPNLQEAKRPFITTLNGVKIGFLSFAEQEFNCASNTEYGANFLDPYEDFDLISEVKKEVDYLLIIYHGGIEYYEYPSPLLQKKCRRFIDKGADLVTCQHSHCIGTIEVYKDKKIVYGQGNTVFGYRKDNPSWNEGLLLKMAISETNSLVVDYIGITATEKGIRLMDMAENQALKDKLVERAKLISEKNFIDTSWKNFCDKKKELYFPQYLGLNRYLIHLNRLSKNKLVSILFANKYLRASHNIIRCEAHNEVLQTILKSKVRKSSW